MFSQHPLLPLCSVIHDYTDIFALYEKSGGGAAIKRPLENYDYNADEPIEKMRCIMEQGYLCVGAVTRAGCAGKEGAPRCITARQACRGTSS